MKKIQLISIAALTLLLSGILFFSCKKDTEDPNLTYIKDFYGVNLVHSFVCLNPTNDSKSLRVDLVWDEKGVATYTITDIPKDTAERNSRIFMPASEYNPDNGTITPTKSVKTILLVLNPDGNLEPLDVPVCGSGYWDCYGACTGSPVLFNGFMNCPPFNYPYCYAYWHCNGTGNSTPVLVGWQSE